MVPRRETITQFRFTKGVSWGPRGECISRLVTWEMDCMDHL
jgi:hypothetical protein